MDQDRKTLNWQAICGGRDLLKELDEIRLNAKTNYEKELRTKLAEEILNPREFKFKSGCAGDSLD